MEYIIIGILIVILVLVTISLFKNINEGRITERLGNLETNVTKELGDFKADINRNLSEDFTKQNERIDYRLTQINDKVNERLDENFDKTNKTFNSVLEKLAKIDEAQKKIDSLSSDIVSLQGILTDKKSRGIFGEVNLTHILSSVFGEKNDSIYRLQYSFDTGVIADAVLFAPEPLGVVAIDSKFPLENYRIMVDKNRSKLDREAASKLFKSDVKKHIDAISDKYIIPGKTSDQAIMFLPAEAIFAEINAYHEDIIEYAYKKRVWITSPTTLMSTLTTIEV
ncbi:MAG: DNA recombination protein RmuC, partial [Peptostreptococcaceae bacterium]|nr:DNA recombination protein RmuC [Peptostreptococcaceae bacterium]